uniref:Uncharacterized protein n=1 Tax=mine drainage metagenome TaxID=410659 RepID=E6PY07_9ZZZZ
MSHGIHFLVHLSRTGTRSELGYKALANNWTPNDIRQRMSVQLRESYQFVRARSTLTFFYRDNRSPGEFQRVSSLLLSHTSRPTCIG